MGTISVGGLLITTPDITNTVVISKEVNGKFNVTVNDVPKIRDFIQYVKNYRIEIYDEFNEMIAYGNADEITVIINGVINTDFTTLDAIELKIIELLTTPSSGSIIVNGYTIYPNGTTGFNFRIGVRDSLLSIDEELTALGFDGDESIDDGVTGDWIERKTF